MIITLQPMKTFNNRKPNRLTEYDYSQPGYYFVTICTNGRREIFGNIANNQLVLNDAGNMIDAILTKIPQYYPGIDIDAHIVMPNHIHAIIAINPYVGTDPRVGPITNNNGQAQGHYRGQAQGPVPTGALSDVVKRFKTLTTKKYIDGVKNNNWHPFNKHLWQRSFYDHVIRNERSLELIRKYVVDNPLMWPYDRENFNRIDVK